MLAPWRVVAVVVRFCLRPLGEAFATLGGIDLYVEERRARWELEDAPVLRSLVGPSADHPERLRPDLPLTAQELGLAAQLAGLGVERRRKR